MKRLLWILPVISSIAFAADIIPIKITSTASGVGSTAFSSVPIQGFLEGVIIDCSNQTNGAVDVDLVLRTDPDSGINSGTTMLDIEGVDGTPVMYTIRKGAIDYAGNSNITNLFERYYIPQCKMQLMATNPTFPSVDVEVRLIVTKE